MNGEFLVKRNMVSYLLWMIVLLCPINLFLLVNYVDTVIQIAIAVILVVIALVMVFIAVWIVRHRNDLFRVELKSEGIYIHPGSHYSKKNIEEIKLTKFILQLRLKDSRKTLVYAIEGKNKREIVDTLENYCTTYKVPFVHKS